MGDSLKKAQAGQKLEIPAETYNAFLDAVRFVRERRHDVGQESTEPLRQSGIIKVRNKSGADRDRDITQDARCLICKASNHLVSLPVVQIEFICHAFSLFRIASCPCALRDTPTLSSRPG
jgi:hypothetical protein